MILYIYKDQLTTEEIVIIYFLYQTVRLYFFFPVMLVAERQGYAGLK